MGDSPDKFDWEGAQFKFSVKSPEGKDVKVAIIPWPRPHARAEGSAAPADAKPDNTALKNPQWGEAQAEQGAQIKHGDHAQMQVEAPGHDGKRVKFIVEQRINGKWKEFQTVTGVVKNGVAQAKVKAEHPAAGKTGPIAPHVLRFRNVFA